MKTLIVNKRGVIAAWIEGRSARTSNHSFSSDGKMLCSYNLPIGATTERGTRVVGDYTSGGGHYYSQTTSTHVGCRD